MNQEARLNQMRYLDPEIQNNELNSVENSILTLLKTRNQQNRTIDVSWLQSECKHIGFTPKEFSHGFVRLLMRGHLEPCGEFAYALAAGNANNIVKDSELSFGSSRSMSGEPLLSVPQKLQDGAEVLQSDRARILLVDDDDDVRTVVTAMLENADYHVVSAESGSKAVSIFRDNQDSFDLLVSDVIMPFMDGSEVYEQVNKLRPGLPTVFISGHPNDILKPLIAAENVKFLRKPLSQRTLVKTIQDILHP